MSSGSCIMITEEEKHVRMRNWGKHPLCVHLPKQLQQQQQNEDSRQSLNALQIWWNQFGRSKCYLLTRCVQVARISFWHLKVIYVMQHLSRYFYFQIKTMSVCMYAWVEVYLLTYIYLCMCLDMWFEITELLNIIQFFMWWVRSAYV